MVDLSEEGHEKPMLQNVPVVSPRSLMNYLFSEDFNLVLDQDDVQKYWEHAVDCFPWGANHPGHDTHIPVGLYGDSARYTSSTGFVEKTMCVIVNLPLWCPASTRASRFLVFAIRENLMVGYKETLWPVFRFLAQELNDLFHNGITVSRLGRPLQTFKFTVTELRGDWEWHCNSLQLVPRWNSIKCCFKCPATTREGDLQYTKVFGDGAAWMPEQYSHVQFINTITKPGAICSLAVL